MAERTRGPWVAIRAKPSAADAAGRNGAGEEGFFGAILAGGRNLLLTDDGDGYSIGSILDTDSIEICYIEAGADAQVFCRTLERRP